MNAGARHASLIFGTAALVALSTAMPAPASAAIGPWVVQPTPNPSATSNSLSAVDAVAAGAWAVGSTVAASTGTLHTLVLNNTGDGWVRQPSPNAKHPDDELLGVAAISSSNVWAVGQHIAGAQTSVVVMHYGGSSWTRVPAPHTAIADNGSAWALAAVAASGPHNVWAVGSAHCTALQCIGYSTGIAEHWNGTKWSTHSLDQAGDIVSLNAVTAVDRSHAWAAGSTASSDLILRWNGSKWSKSTIPTPNKAVLNGITALGQSNVWAVGQFTKNGHVRTLVLHHTGTGWHRVTSPNKGQHDSSLTSVSASSSHNIWAVGSFHAADDTDHTLIEHYDGVSWSIVSSPNAASTDNGLNGVAAVSGNNVYAVGTASSSGQSTTLAMHCC